MITMLEVEIRRCCSRPLVRWLIVVAVVLCAVTGVIAHRDAAKAGTLDQFRLVEVWVPGEDSPLGVAAVALLIGAVIGGASMIGAEWRAGTFVTLLTWEPNRARVAVAKLIACGAVATVVAVLLQTLFCAALLPAALGPGSTAGVDADWFVSLVGGALRIAALTGLAAMLMASIAMVGRNTAAALGVAFGYLMVVESLVGGWKPWATRFLLGPNGAVFVTGGSLETDEFTRSTLTAGLTLAGYVVLGGMVAVATFRRRDLASAG